MRKSAFLLVFCSVLLLAAHVPKVEAAHYISTMDIDVNYDPFTDSYKNIDSPVALEGTEKKATFSQRLAENTNVNKPSVVVSQSKIVPGNVYLPKGTPLNVELSNRIDCKLVRKFQNIEFRTTENLFVNDVIVIPKGTVGKGYIYDVQAPGAFGRKGVLRIAGKEISTINGVKIPLMKGISATGKTDGGAIVVGAVVSLAGGFFMKGKGISFPAGTDFVVEIREDTDLGCKPHELAKVMDPSIPRGQKIYVSGYEFPNKRR